MDQVYTSNRFLTTNSCDTAIEILREVNYIIPRTLDDYNDSNYSPFICDCIRYHTSFPGPVQHKTDLCNWINELIGRNFSIFTLFSLDRDNSDDFKKAQEYRLILIDYMIRELELKKQYLESKGV